MKDVSSILQKKLNGLLGQPNKYEKTSLLSRLNSSINPFSVLIYKGFPNHFFFEVNFFRLCNEFNVPQRFQSKTVNKL